METNSSTIMKTLLLSLLFISFLSILQTTFSKSPSEDIAWWCNKTPHPEPCRYFLTTSRNRYWPRRWSEFRKILVQEAMDQTIHELRPYVNSGPKFDTKCQKTAWKDCLKLYDYTIHHLNRTFLGFHGNGSCTNEDAQTWLSTALTHIETCRFGCQDLNVSDFVTPYLSQNVSKLISNGLAVNGVLLKASKSRGDEHPSWFSEHDRKLLESSASLAKRAHLVVAADGSGRFRKVQDAINAAAKRRRMGRFIIYVKKGVYRENIEVTISNNNIMLVGDGMGKTIITGSRSVTDGFTTYSSATAGIDGLHFIARDITFINSAGPHRGQAVALRSASDLSIFYRCSIEGYQDTLMVHAQRQFFRECKIYGTVDFIFGNAAVVFQSCVIYVRRPLTGQANMITAQGRGDPFQNTGIAIHNSQIRPAPDLKPVVGAFKTYLGRPWQQYSRTAILKTYIDGLVSPQGWSPWGNSDFALNTLYYGEYKNFGPGASTRSRVKWRGYHAITSDKEASQFTVRGLLTGPSWLASAAVPFTSGL